MRLPNRFSLEYPVDAKFRPTTSHTDYSDASSSRRSTPALENQCHQSTLPFPRRISIAGNPSYTRVPMNTPRSNYPTSRRFSAPNIQIKYTPEDQGQVTPKPQNPPLKLYPWMTRKEVPPQREPMVKCPYPTNDCTEILRKNLTVLRVHFAEKHGLTKDATLQTCQWPGCGRVMGGRSLNRHVLMTHMDLKTRCPYCNVRWRPDHVEKHVEKCRENPAREK